MKNPKFVICSGKDEQFYFQLTARNGQTILTGQGYSSKSGCKNGIESVKSHAAEEAQFNQLQASNGEFYFTLVAKNNEIIGRSETYKSKQGRDNSIKSVMENAPGAPVEDTTL